MTPDPVLAAALRDIAALHEPTSGMGYLEGGRYDRKDPVCETCGTSDEYGVDWPCSTRQLADAGLAALQQPAHPEGWRAASKRLHESGDDEPYATDDPLRDLIDLIGLYRIAKDPQDVADARLAVEKAVAALRADSHDGGGLREAVEAYAREHPRWLSDEEDGCPESLALRRALSKEQGDD